MGWRPGALARPDHWARRAKVQVKWSIATFRNSVHIGSILKRRGLKLLAAEIKMQAS